LEKAARDEVDHFLPVNFAVLRLTMAGSFLDMPGVTIPTGFSSEELPTGMLLAGLGGEDGRVLTAAASVERIIGP
jgi:aspartyl-tRNA(Asn)/glutamyl-tRNA(Gln) amidotransferase subunit A